MCQQEHGLGSSDSREKIRPLAKNTSAPPEDTSTLARHFICIHYGVELLGAEIVRTEVSFHKWRKFPDELAEVYFSKRVQVSKRYRNNRGESVQISHTGTQVIRHVA